LFIVVVSSLLLLLPPLFLILLLFLFFLFFLLLKAALAVVVMRRLKVALAKKVIEEGRINEEYLSGLELLYKTSTLVAALEILDSPGGVVKFIGARTGQFVHQVSSTKEMNVSGPCICFGGYCSCPYFRTHFIHGEICRHLLAIKIAEACKTNMEERQVADEKIRDFLLHSDNSAE
jgi:predicted nucleic acid-binding Zn finger protein